MQKSDLDKSLTETLRESELASLGAEWGELAIDSVLDEGVLKDIPIISALRALWKTGLAVRDQLFLRKLVPFLTELGQVPAAQRQEMIERLENDETYSQRVGEHIILLLDRLDNMRKPMLLARAFRAYIEGRADALELQRVLYVIDRVLYPDLDYLSSFLAGKKVPPAVIQGYVNCGLAWSPPGYSTSMIKPTETASIFLERILPAR